MGAPKGGGAAACPAGTAFHERVRHGGGGESVTCLDALAREVRTARRGFDGAWIHVDTEHDALGRVRRVSEPHYAGEAQCSAGQGDSRCWTATDHDILGRAVKVTGPDGSATTFARRGLATATTNALGQAAKETRNALGETVLTEDHHGGTVEFARDAQGNVVRTTRRKPPSDASPAPASVATTATFDLLGRMTAQDDPDLGRVRYLYNSLGEPRCRQDAAGNLTVTAPDGLGRMASRRDYRAHGAVTCDSLRQAQAADSGNNATTTLYLGNVERVTHPDATVTVRRRIGGVAIELEGPARGGCEADAVRYVLRDHLGSVDVLADASGAAAQSMGFTAWGARRNPDGWTELADAAARSFDACATARGFTGHEMLDAVGAVHMNGRLYDPALGRFLRADPFVQFPKDLQGHNRYSYALNNPLSYTDPSGHFILTLAASAFIATATANIGLVTTISTLAAAGFGDALLHGASFRQALLAGFASGVSAGAFSGIGTALQGRFGGTFAAGLSPAGFGLKALAHGTVGGIASALGGGRFGHGFASGGLAALGSGLNNSRLVGRAGFSPLRVAVGAAIGGTASRVTGGKFANGAVTGAFSQALNNERAEARLKARIDRVVGAVAADYGDVLEAGNIDLKANIKEARKIGFWKFVNRMRPGRDWDYKAHINAEAAGLDPTRIAEFGNLHYGIVAAARGYSLQFALSGAGGAQYFLQEGGSLVEFVGPYAAPLALAPSSLTAMNLQGADPIWYPMLSREGAIRWMQSGGTFGDLPEDNYFVRRGWDLYHDN